MTYKLAYSDYSTTTGPPDPAAWVGPPGPPGPQGIPGPKGEKGAAGIPIDAPPTGSIYGRGGNPTPTWQPVLTPAAGAALPFLPLSGGTVTGNVGVTGEVVPARLNLGGAGGGGLGATLTTTPDHTTSPIWANTFFGGTNAATANQNFNSIIVNDNVTYTGSGLSNALHILQNAQANATRAGGLWVESQQTAAPTNPFGFCVALTAASSLAYNCGGTALTFGNTRGAATTFNTYTSAGPGATFITGIVGYELDIHAQAGSSLGGKTGILIARLSDDTVSGAFGTDTGVAFSANGSTAGWDYMFLLGEPSSQIPFKPTATLIGCAEPQTPASGQALATWGIDLSSVLFSGGFARSLGFLVDGSGNVTGQRFNMNNWAFTPSSTGLAITATGYQASLTSIAAGGTGWVVGDKVRTASGGVYRVTTVSGTAVTAVAQLVADATAAVPGNPVATTATNTSIYRTSGSGLTLNLAWTAANMLSVPGSATIGALTTTSNVLTFGSGQGAATVYLTAGNTGNTAIALASAAAFAITQGGGVALFIEAAATPVNYFDIQPAASGGTVWATAAGGDPNIILGLNGKGSGGVQIGSTLKFYSLPTNAANDAAAASAGVPVNAVYRNGSILMVRVA